MTTTVFLVRHGAQDRLGTVLCGRMPGVALGAQGRAEAEAVAARLRRRTGAVLYASPLERAVQTAAPIAVALGGEVRIDPDLNEIDYGAWAGLPFEALRGPAWSAWNAERETARAPGGESMAEVQGRIGAFLDRVVKDHPNQDVVAVSHADVIKAAVMKVLGLPHSAHARVEISPGSVSVLVGGDWGFKVHSINEAVT